MVVNFLLSESQVKGLLYLAAPVPYLLETGVVLNPNKSANVVLLPVQTLDAPNTFLAASTAGRNELYGPSILNAPPTGSPFTIPFVKP